MKLKQLESSLCRCGMENIEFHNPDITLEQYPTSPQLTAHIIYMAHTQYNDIGRHRTVIDLGCGTGMLSIGWYVCNELFY
jgi:rRNA N6-adenosine-methyltransferase METTL5